MQPWGDPDRFAERIAAFESDPLGHVEEHATEPEDGLELNHPWLESSERRARDLQRVIVARGAPDGGDADFGRCVREAQMLERRDVARGLLDALGPDGPCPTWLEEDFEFE